MVVTVVGVHREEILTVKVHFIEFTPKQKRKKALRMVQYIQKRRLKVVHLRALVTVETIWIKLLIHNKNDFVHALALPILERCADSDIHTSDPAILSLLKTAHLTDHSWLIFSHCPFLTDTVFRDLRRSIVSNCLSQPFVTRNSHCSIPRIWCLSTGLLNHLRIQSTTLSCKRKCAKGCCPASTCESINSVGLSVCW